MSLLVVGSVAFDALESPYGKVERAVGGAATYFAVAASFFRAFAVPSALGLVFWIETKMHQRIVALARFHPDVTAMTAIAARRPAPRNVFLPPERHAAVAAIASLNSNFGFIDKHDM